ncbi:hypothetical protein J6590_042194 [Homalodisca vitripennis]|nr:hypothetical protein J6590_042194 [Homalodisca vitripennis]
MGGCILVLKVLADLRNNLPFFAKLRRLGERFRFFQGAITEIVSNIPYHCGCIRNSASGDNYTSKPCRAFSLNHIHSNTFFGDLKDLHNTTDVDPLHPRRDSLPLYSTGTIPLTVLEEAIKEETLDIQLSLRLGKYLEKKIINKDRDHPDHK